MLDLSRFNVAVFVFAMPDCGACENYMPRFTACVERRQALREPFWIYNPETEATDPIPAGAVPILFLDVSSDDKTIGALADRLHVSGTPCTVVMLRGPGTFKVEGALPSGHIEQILDAALERR